VSEENGDLADDLSISDGEMVLRRVHPDLVKPETGQPDRSVFKNDPGGLGTSVTLWRSPSDLRLIIGGREKIGVVAITVGEARAQGLRINFTNEDGNPNHCEIFGPRSKGKLGQLRACARWVVYPEGYPNEHRGQLFDLHNGTEEAK